MLLNDLRTIQNRQNPILGKATNLCIYICICFSSCVTKQMDYIQLTTMNYYTCFWKEQQLFFQRTIIFSRDNKFYIALSVAYWQSTWILHTPNRVVKLLKNTTDPTMSLKFFKKYACKKIPKACKNKKTRAKMFKISKIWPKIITAV